MLSSSPWAVAAVVLMVFVSSLVLVAEIPMFALKFKTWGWSGNEVKYIFIVTCVPMLLLLGMSGFAAVIAWYVALSVFTSRRKA